MDDAHDLGRAFHAAVEAGDLGEFRRLISGWPFLARYIMALIRAVELGRADMVADFIKGGADVNMTDELGDTPLMSAARLGHPGITRMLVEAGANPDALAEDVEPQIDWECRGRSALHDAIACGHDEVVAYLTPLTSPWLRLRAEMAIPDRPGPADEALDRAAASGDAGAVRASLDAGADPRTRTGEERRTALHAAAEAGRAGLIPLLIEAGAAVDARDERGRTALWRAAHRGNGPVVEALLRHGADPDARDFDDEATPLIRAVLADAPGAVDALLAAGADPYLAAADGLTAFDHAAYQDVPDARGILEREFGMF
ncbi:ankyrin repeat domain-containing protein [Tundrisphaera sp. TA3]|uniref:ankyrin repeat domain-containing protein n=1 Tax=Tundrisphaera sp. TA3 TaxID=3435775 RepID=UPI003EB97AC3